MSGDKDNTKYDSWCHTSFEQEKEYNHKWKIENFSRAVDTHPPCEFMECNEFCVPITPGKIPIFLRLYPCRIELDEGEDPDTVELIISQHNGYGDHFKLSLEVAIIDREGKRQRVQKLGMGCGDFVCDLVKHSELFDEDSNLLDSDGNLTLSLKFTPHPKDYINKSFTASDSVEENTAHIDHMKNMLENADEYFSDMEIQCLDGNIPCHSSILASKTPVLQAMFKSDMMEARTRKVNMKSLTKEMVFNILTFIYTGKIDAEITSLELLKEADKLGLLDLVAECSKQLSKHLNVTNCVSTIILADRIVSANILKMAAKRFILENLTTQVLEDIKKNCDKDLMMELLEEVGINPPAKRIRIY